MRFKKALKISVYVMTDEEQEADRLGLGVNELKYEGNMRPFYFFSIDYMVDYKQDERMSSFISGGEEFYTNVSVDQLIKTIENHIIKWG